MVESTITSIKCPCCGELVPVRLDLQGLGVENGTITFAGTSPRDDPFPIVELALALDLDQLKDGGLDDLLEKRREIKEALHIKL